MSWSYSPLPEGANGSVLLRPGVYLSRSLSAVGASWAIQVWVYFHSFANDVIFSVAGAQGGCDVRLRSSGNIYSDGLDNNETSYTTDNLSVVAGVWYCIVLSQASGNKIELRRRAESDAAMVTAGPADYDAIGIGNDLQFTIGNSASVSLSMFGAKAFATSLDETAALAESQNVHPVATANAIDYWRLLSAATATQSASGTRNFNSNAGTPVDGPTGPAISGAVTLAASAANLSLAGQTAAPLVSRALACDAANLGLSGEVVQLLAQRALTAETGNLTLAGVDTALRVARTILAEAGALALAAPDVALRAARIIQAEAGALVLAGVDVELVIEVVAEFVTAAQHRTVRGTRRLRTVEGEPRIRTAVGRRRVRTVEA